MQVKITGSQIFRHCLSFSHAFYSSFYDFYIHKAVQTQQDMVLPTSGPRGFGQFLCNYMFSLIFSGSSFHKMSLNWSAPGGVGGRVPARQVQTPRDPGDSSGETNLTHDRDLWPPTRAPHFGRESRLGKGQCSKSGPKGRLRMFFFLIRRETSTYLYLYTPFWFGCN